LIRSRRRRALLRDGGSKPSTHPYAWIRSLDPERTLGRGPPGSASSERSPITSEGGSDGAHGQCH